MNILLSFDSFKGSISAREVSMCLAQSMPSHAHHIISLADGGEGSLACIQEALPDCQTGTIETVDPFLRPLQAPYLMHKNTLYLESAHIIGLPLIPPKQRNPLSISSFGIGLALRDAPPAQQIVIALGGTATVDGGLGMADFGCASRGF